MAAEFVRPPLPRGFDESRAHDRRVDPAGWRLPEPVGDALALVVGARRDIRRFRPDPVPDDALSRMLEAAHHAPSVGYMQPWRFVLIRSPETKIAVRSLAERERLRQAARFDDRARHFLEQKIEGIREAPLGICVCCDRGEPEAEVLGRGTIRDTDLYSTACAIQNLWLTARAQGVGIGWVSFYRPDDLRSLLGIPARVVPVAYLCVGYPDERPTRPGLESAGWAARLPLADVVFEERWPEPTAAHARAAPLARAVKPADPAAAAAARDRADELVKPAGSLGALETLVERWSAASGEPPPERLRPAIVVFAGDHGVARRGASLFAQRVSAQVAAAAARGETAIGVLASARDAPFVVADVGLVGPTPAGVQRRRVRDGAGDIAHGPAMTPGELERALAAGADIARDLVCASDCLVLGEIGIGNTTAAAALLAALCDMPAEAVCGRGTGLDAAGLRRKRQLVASALAANPRARTGAAEALQHLGGVELAALVGAMLAAGEAGGVVVLDGFACGVAALAAARISPPLRERFVAGHRSAEPAHGHVLTELGLEPLLDLRLRLGEGSGAALALPLIEQAGRLHRAMGTFATARVDHADANGASAR